MSNTDVLYKFAFVDGITRPFYAWTITDEERQRYQNAFYRTINGVKTTMVFVQRSGTRFFRINPNRTFPTNAQPGGAIETESHKAAKTIFIDNWEKVVIHIPNKVKCPVCDVCSDYKDGKCVYKTEGLSFKLMERYGEQPILEPNTGKYDFTPDILFKNSNGEEFWVEINSTHKVESEKIWHGTPILEIDIKDDEDIEWLYRHKNFYEGEQTHYYNLWAMPFVKAHYCDELSSKYAEMRTMYQTGDLGLGINDAWPFPKHKGESLLVVFQNDRDYFDWCLKQKHLSLLARLSRNCKTRLGLEQGNET